MLVQGLCTLKRCLKIESARVSIGFFLLHFSFDAGLKFMIINSKKDLFFFFKKKNKQNKKHLNR